MNWSRAKTILIALLLVVNVLLGGIWGYREAQARVREARATEELCAILYENGLTVKPEQLAQTLAMTYDVERSSEEGELGDGEPDGERFVHGLPVWDSRTVSGTRRWLWNQALPVKGKTCLSSGYCLLLLTEQWNRSGVLESCELGYIPELISPDVLRLKPCWRFVISGEVFECPAA